MTIEISPIFILFEKKTLNQSLPNYIFQRFFMKFRHFLIMIFFHIRLSRLYTDAAADVEGLTWPSISSIWHWGGNDLRFKNAFTHFFDVTHCTQWMGSMPQYNEKAIWALIIHVVPSLIKERLFMCLSTKYVVKLKLRKFKKGIIFIELLFKRLPLKA